MKSNRQWKISAISHIAQPLNKPDKVQIQDKFNINNDAVVTISDSTAHLSAVASSKVNKIHLRSEAAHTFFHSKLSFTTYLQIESLPVRVASETTRIVVNGTVQVFVGDL